MGSARYLGIDYGEKRIGLSWGDELGLAFPLEAAHQETLEERWQAIGAQIAARQVTALILGMPYNMDGSIGFKAREVEAFAGELRAKFGLPVHLVDERLSSSEARKLLGKRLGRDRETRQSGLLDSAAATLILQDYLDQHHGAGFPEEWDGDVSGES